MPEKKRREEDRLSSLPDDLLHRIMDFMTAKCAMRTCVLSRRWERVWSSCPNLHFDELEFTEEKDLTSGRAYNRPFMNFVDRALIFSDATDLNRVSISAHRYTDMTRVTSWVHTVVARNVRDLTVSISQNTKVYLPTRLFSLRSLKRLSFTVLNQPMRWPHGAVTALEDLTLCGLEFVTNTARDVISSTCPRLRILKMERCAGLSQLHVNLPDLQVFSLDRCKGLKDLFVSGPSLVTISINETFLHAGEGSAPGFEISAPKLRWFAWSDRAVHRFKSSSKMLPSRADVALKTFRVREGRDLLIRLNGTYHLSITCFSFWTCIWNGPLPASSYQNLEVLQLLVDFSMANDDVAAAIYRSLGCFPNLKTLDIRNVKEKEHNILSQWFFQANKALEVQDCDKHQMLSLRHLREVGFNDFTGSCWQMDYIKRILGAAPDLQIMTITASDCDVKHNFSQIIEELQKLPSASPRAKLILKQPCHLQHHGGHQSSI